MFRISFREGATISRVSKNMWYDGDGLFLSTCNICYLNLLFTNSKWSVVRSVSLKPNLCMALILITLPKLFPESIRQISLPNSAFVILLEMSIGMHSSFGTLRLVLGWSLFERPIFFQNCATFWMSWLMTTMWARLEIRKFVIEEWLAVSSS